MMWLAFFCFLDCRWGTEKGVLFLWCLPKFQEPVWPVFELPSICKCAVYIQDVDFRWVVWSKSKLAWSHCALKTWHECLWCVSSIWYYTVSKTAPPVHGLQYSLPLSEPVADTSHHCWPSGGLHQSVHDLQSGTNRERPDNVNWVHHSLITLVQP